MFILGMIEVPIRAVTRHGSLQLTIGASVCQLKNYRSDSDSLLRLLNAKHIGGLPVYCWIRSRIRLELERLATVGGSTKITPTHIHRPNFFNPVHLRS